MDRCMVCGSTNVKRFYALPNYPLVAGPVVSQAGEVKLCDIVLGYCFNCGVCSIVSGVTEGLQYGNDYTSSNMSLGNSASMDAVTLEFLDFIGRLGKPSGSKVLEIGAYDGSFMGLMADRYGFEVVGCEPCAEVAKEALNRGYKVSIGEFVGSAYSQGRFDLVVCRNVLEHITEPVGFLRGIRHVLKSNCQVVFELPNGEKRIADGVLGSIVPEHPCYYGRQSLLNLLRSIFDGVVVMNGNGILRAVASCPDVDTPEHPLSDMKGRMGRFYHELLNGQEVAQTRKSVICDLVSNIDKIHIYGANTCTVELLAGGIKENKVGRIFDDDKRKWGKYLVNTDLPISPLEEIGDSLPNSTVLVCSYRHQSAIGQNLRKIATRPFGLITLYPHLKLQRVMP